MKVVFLPDVLLYLEELSHKLYFNHYLGFEESAREYVDELIDFIRDELPHLHRKAAPRYFDKYGQDMDYVTFRKNKHTHWYVFFNEYEVDGEVVFQIRHITNNHVIAQYL